MLKTLKTILSISRRLPICILYSPSSHPFIVFARSVFLFSTVSLSLSLSLSPPVLILISLLTGLFCLTNSSYLHTLFLFLNLNLFSSSSHHKKVFHSEPCHFSGSLWHMTDTFNKLMFMLK